MESIKLIIRKDKNQIELQDLNNLKEFKNDENYEV